MRAPCRKWFGGYLGTVPAPRTLRVAVATCLVAIVSAPTVRAARTPASSADAVAVITISSNSNLTSAEVSRISAAARSVGATAHAVRYATLAMTAYLRGDDVLMQIGRAHV